MNDQEQAVINPAIDTLFLSDDKVFYTVEGEGTYAGVPSVFMRLSMCNLTCKGFASNDSPYGCDSFVSWSVKNRLTFNEIIDNYFIKTGYVERLKNGAILKLTGGEPFIQQKQLIRFIQYFVKLFNFTPRIDFETNATIMPLPAWKEEFNATFTTSPKLKSNGDPEELRYKPEVLNYHARVNSGFKFVVQSIDDIKEIEEMYVNRFNIKKSVVYLMPCCGSRKELIEKSAQVVEWCKEYNYLYSPRLQLLVWDKALKV